MAGATLAWFGAFALAFYVAGGLLSEGFERVRRSSFLPNEQPARQIAALLRSRDHRMILNAIGAFFGAVFALNLRAGPAIVLFGAAAGWMLPALLVSRQERKRLARLEQQIVSALTLLSNSMRAGKTLPQAIDEVSASLEQPMAQELSVISRQLRVGMKPEEALRAFAERVPLPDVKLAVRAMIVSLRTGSNLPHAMRQIATTVASRIRVEGKIKVLTTQGNMQGMIVGAAPFVLLAGFYVMSPQYVQVLFDTRLGNLILAGMVVLQTAAVVTIRKITSVKV